MGRCLFRKALVFLSCVAAFVAQGSAVHGASGSDRDPYDAEGHWTRALMLQSLYFSESPRLMFGDLNNQLMLAGWPDITAPDDLGQVGGDLGSRVDVNKSIYWPIDFRDHPTVKKRIEEGIGYFKSRLKEEAGRWMARRGLLSPKQLQEQVEKSLQRSLQVREVAEREAPFARERAQAAAMERLKYTYKVKDFAEVRQRGLLGEYEKLIERNMPPPEKVRKPRPMSQREFGEWVRSEQRSLRRQVAQVYRIALTELFPQVPDLKIALFGSDPETGAPVERVLDSGDPSAHAILARVAPLDWGSENGLLLIHSHAQLQVLDENGDERQLTFFRQGRKGNRRYLTLNALADELSLDVRGDLVRPIVVAKYIRLIEETAGYLSDAISRARDPKTASHRIRENGRWNVSSWESGDWYEFRHFASNRETAPRGLKYWGIARDPDYWLRREYQASRHPRRREVELHAYIWERAGPRTVVKQIVKELRKDRVELADPLTLKAPKAANPAKVSASDEAPDREIGGKGSSRRMDREKDAGTKEVRKGSLFGWRGKLGGSGSGDSGDGAQDGRASAEAGGEAARAGWDIRFYAKPSNVKGKGDRTGGQHPAREPLRQEVILLNRRIRENFVIVDKERAQRPALEVTLPSSPDPKARLLRYRSRELLSAPSSLLEVPSPLGRELRAFELRDSAGRMLVPGLDYRLLRAGDGSGYFVELQGEDPRRKVELEAGFLEKPALPRELPDVLFDLPVDRLREAEASLREAGFTEVAGALARRLEARGPISILELEAQLSSSALYSRVPESVELPSGMGPSNPFAKYAKFAHQGRLCGQCDSANELFGDLMNLLVQDHPRIRFSTVVTAISKTPLQGLLKGRIADDDIRHAMLQLEIDGVASGYFDATPWKHDPRNPGESFVQRFRKLFENLTRRWRSLRRNRLLRPSPSQEGEIRKVGREEGRRSEQKEKPKEEAKAVAVSSAESLPKAGAETKQALDPEDAPRESPWIRSHVARSEKMRDEMGKAFAPFGRKLLTAPEGALYRNAMALLGVERRFFSGEIGFERAVADLKDAFPELNADEVPGPARLLELIGSKAREEQGRIRKLASEWTAGRPGGLGYLERPENERRVLEALEHVKWAGEVLSKREPELRSHLQFIRNQRDAPACIRRSLEDLQSSP